MNHPTRAAVLLAIAVPGALHAQAPGRAPRVLEIPASARAMALGDAYMMNAGHADALFYHPALLTNASGFGLDVQNWSGEGTAAVASAAMQWLGGGVAIGLQTLQYGVDRDTLSNVPGGQDLLFRGGSIPVSERVGTVGYARRVAGFRVGVSGKLIEQRFGSARDATAAFDVGVATDLGPLTVGLTGTNLGPDLELSSRAVELPTRFTLGAGRYGQQVGPLDMGVAAALTRRDDGEWIPSAGVELGYWPITGRTFVARVGAQRVPEGAGAVPSFGFAFWGDALVLEWAYRRFGDPGEGTHRFGVRWR